MRDSLIAGEMRFLLATSMAVAFVSPAGAQSRGQGVAAPVPCVADARSASAAALWEQAAAGFQTMVGRRGSAPRLEILRYVGISTYPHSGESDPAKAKRPPAADLVLAPDLLGTESFASNVPWADVRSARELETRGYVVRGWTGTEVHQPVPAVLLDSSFIRSHCFTLADARADRPQQVGVAFRPAPDRAKLGDVEGVLWLTGSPATLVALEYRYVGPPSVLAERIEGRMTFRAVANGAVTVDSWTLTAARAVIPVFPTYGAPDSTSSRANRDGVFAVRQPTGGGSFRSSRVDTLWRAGLMVLSAAWPDRTAIQRTLPMLAGRVVDAATSAPLAGQAIRLSQLWVQTTGAGGEFSVGPMPAGRFTVTATDTALDRFGVFRSVSSTLAVDTSGIAPITLRMPSAYDAAMSGCQKTLRGGGKGVVAFRAVDSTGAPRSIGGVTVTVMTHTGGREVVVLSRAERTDRGGRRPLGMVLCGVSAANVVADFSFGPMLRGDDFVQVTGKAVLDTLTVLVRGGR